MKPSKFYRRWRYAVHQNSPKPRSVQQQRAREHDAHVLRTQGPMPGWRKRYIKRLEQITGE